MPHAKANGLSIYYESHGADGAEPILLIMGLGAQMTRWSPDMIGKLTAAGHRVIVFDNRDVGLTEKLDSAGAPDIREVVAAISQGRPAPVAYTLSEMAADAAGLLAAPRHRTRAHRRRLDGRHDRPAGRRRLPRAHRSRSPRSCPRPATPACRAPSPRRWPGSTRRRPNPTENLEAFLDSSVEGAKVMGGSYPVNEALVREQALSDFHRSYYPVGFQRQYAGIMASPDRRPKLNTITAPTVVIHGDVDPLVPVEGGRDTAENIPGAELIIVPGVGHEMPAAVLDVFVDGILSAVARSKAQAKAAE